MWCGRSLNLFSLASCDNRNLGLLSTNHHALQLRFVPGHSFNKRYGETENPCGEGGVKQDFRLVKGFFSSSQVLFERSFFSPLTIAQLDSHILRADGRGNGAFCDFSAYDFLFSFLKLFIIESQYVVQSPYFLPKVLSASYLFFS